MKVSIRDADIEIVEKYNDYTELEQLSQSNEQQIAVTEIKRDTERTDAGRTHELDSVLFPPFETLPERVFLPTAHVQ